MSFKKTELGNIPIEWKVEVIENVLEEIIDYRGKTPKKANEGIETLSAKSVKNGYIDYSNAYYISPKTYKEFMVRGFPKKDDILLTTEAPLGNVAKLNKDNVAIAQRLLTLRGKENYMANEYLMYYLMSVIGQHQLHSRATGTTVTGIKQSEFRKILITVPTFHEQKSIANILSSLDGKIEINNQITGKLEEMAQAIYKQWFVDFEFPNEDGEPYKSSGGEMVESELGSIPKGWEIKNFSDFVESISQSINKKEKKQAVFLNTSDILDGEFLHNNYSNVSEMPGQAKKLIRKNDILFSEIRPKNRRFAYVGFDAEDYVVSTKLMVLRTNEQLFSSKCVYLFLKKKNTLDELQHRAESRSGTFPQITFKELATYKFAIPKKEKFIRYFAILEKLVDHQYILKNENKALISLRDELLPKLISGEIRVPVK